jgi:hypothetical protein
MSKIELSSVASGYDLSIINSNFQKIEDELNDKVLYREVVEGEDNALVSDIDANGVSIYNLPEPSLNSEPATKKYVDDRTSFDSNAAESAAEAAASALEAQGYANDAAQSAQDAQDAADELTFVWKGAWVTATAYGINDAVKQNGSSYLCLVPHTSGVFNTDLSNNLWDILAEAGTDGLGSGDMVAANNLSDLTNVATARSNLGLGSAALNNTGDFATAAHNHTGVYEPADADIMKRDVETDITGAMTHTPVSLTDAANIDWNLDTQQNATVTLGGNRTVNAPTNAKAGRFVALRVVQDGTGGRTIAFNTAYKGLTGRTPVTTAGAVNFYLFRCIDSTNLACVSFSANCEA